MNKSTLSGKQPPKNIYNEMIVVILLIFWVHTLVSNFIQLQSLKNLLAFYTLNMALVAWLILIAKTIVIALIFFQRTRLPGFFAALLLIFFAGIVIIRYPHYPHNFGGFFNNISRSQQWILITSISILSVIGIITTVLQGRQFRKQANTTNVVYT
jgi:hypothetical protein